MAVPSSPDRHVRLLYIGSVIGAGVLTIGWSTWSLAIDPPGIQWVILSALTLFTGSLTVKAPALQARISVSDTFVFTSALLFGPAAGTITVVLDALVISLGMKREQRSVVRVSFNATAPAIALWVASETFFELAHVEPGQIDRGDVGRMILPAFAFALVYFLINTGLVAGALATERKESALAIWRAHFPPVSIPTFVGSSIAMLMVAYTDRIDLTVLSIIVPLLVVSHLTFRSSMGRVEDAERHVGQVNEMYLSTVETLAMAVDAKDQITHGHIRRVQVFAVELAKRLGVTHQAQLKAIEIAALLHDMGKLAMPEHILNKPGMLTSAEFATMKRHADIGADLLSSIKFPYPVVPIVRHHHENWDGSGYPSGIAKTDIPIGARILSVVDCFDALTSDRPYRPRLTTDEAFAVLRERSATMYDPLIVDGFIAAHPELAPAAMLAGDRASTVGSIEASAPADSQPFDGIRASATQASTLSELRRALGEAKSIDEATSVATRFVRTLTPSSVGAFFTYFADNDVLTCTDTSGANGHLLIGLTMQRGEHISGWVAANDRTIANSAAVLDLGEAAKIFTPRLQSTIAGAVLTRGRLIGVLSGYAAREAPFNESHRYAFEQLVDALATRIESFGSTSTSAIIQFPISDRR